MQSLLTNNFYPFVSFNTVKECRIPPSGIHTTAIPKDYTATYGTIYNYECIDGYETRDSYQTKCMADGTWSLEAGPTCKGTRIMQARQS